MFLDCTSKTRVQNLVDLDLNRQKRKNGFPTRENENKTGRKKYKFLCFDYWCKTWFVNRELAKLWFFHKDATVLRGGKEISQKSIYRVREPARVRMGVSGERILERKTRFTYLGMEKSSFGYTNWLVKVYIWNLINPIWIV